MSYDEWWKYNGDEEKINLLEWSNIRGHGGNKIHDYFKLWRALEVWKNVWRGGDDWEEEEGQRGKEKWRKIGFGTL